MKILRTKLKKMGEAHKACEMNVTLWAHLWTDHLLGWARKWGHIAIFAAFKGVECPTVRGSDTSLILLVLPDFCPLFGLDTM